MELESHSYEATFVPPRYTAVVHEAPKFDLSSYISNYRGRTVFRRLHLIASCSTVLREEAVRMALVEARKSSDVHSYQEAVSLAQQIIKGKETFDVDNAWVVQQEKRNTTETDRMERELKGYKNNLIKESIRMGNEDLGTHYYTIGELGKAIKAYNNMRDYCTTPAHIAASAFRVIAVSIEQRNWLSVQSQVYRIRNLQMKTDDTNRTQPRINAAMGLQQMSQGHYKEAAHSFLDIDPSLGESYNEVLTSNDVAVYGGLCALASMSRTELQTKVLESASFRNFLELEPHIRRAISFFCACKYSQCLDILEQYRADYLLDIYLQPLVNDIYKRIRTKSIVQYFQPFSRVTLGSMEKMFGKLQNSEHVNGGGPLFQDELIELIESGKLSARIDLEHNVLVAKESNTRADMQKEALDMVDAFIREARSKIIRQNVVNAGLEVKAPTKKQKGWNDAEGNNLDFGQQFAIDQDAGPGRFGGGNFQGGGYSLRGGR